MCLSFWLKNFGIETIRQMFNENELIFLEKDYEYIKKLIFKESFTPNDEREIWSYFVFSKWFKNNNISY